MTGTLDTLSSQSELSHVDGLLRGQVGALNIYSLAVYDMACRLAWNDIDMVVLLPS